MPHLELEREHGRDLLDAELLNGVLFVRELVRPGAGMLRAKRQFELTKEATWQDAQTYCWPSFSGLVYLGGRRVRSAGGAHLESETQRDSPRQRLGERVLALDQDAGLGAQVERDVEHRVDGRADGAARRAADVALELAVEGRVCGKKTENAPVSKEGRRTKRGGRRGLTDRALAVPRRAARVLVHLVQGGDEEPARDTGWA